ncbi:hypothetical protein EDB83DRAFT_474215 [Lactarius deliciosus]|nr:hypothetical protein EDB83DRAFT_474215 [Lactarius deliciosus]
MDNAVHIGRLIRCRYSNPRSTPFALTFSPSPRFISDSFFFLIPPCRLPEYHLFVAVLPYPPSGYMPSAMRYPYHPAAGFAPWAACTPHLPTLCLHPLTAGLFPCVLPARRIYSRRRPCPVSPAPSRCRLCPVRCMSTPIAGLAPCVACTLPPPALPHALRAYPSPLPHASLYPPTTSLASCAACLLPSPTLHRASLYPPAASDTPGLSLSPEKALFAVATYILDSLALTCAFPHSVRFLSAAFRASPLSRALYAPGFPLIPDSSLCVLASPLSPVYLIHPAYSP